MHRVFHPLTNTRPLCNSVSIPIAALCARFCTPNAFITMAEQAVVDMTGPGLTTESFDPSKFLNAMASVLQASPKTITIVSVVAAPAQSGRRLGASRVSPTTIVVTTNIATTPESVRHHILLVLVLLLPAVVLTGARYTHTAANRHSSSLMLRATCPLVHCVSRFSNLFCMLWLYGCRVLRCAGQ